jgi:hypothetical protein
MPNTNTPQAAPAAVLSRSLDPVGFAVRDALEALDTAAESLRSLEALFWAIKELALADSRNTPETRRRFLAELARVGAYCASDWANGTETERETVERNVQAASAPMRGDA